MRNLFPAFALVALFSCSESPKLFTLLSSADTGVAFQNTLQEDEKHNLFDYHTVYNGAGVAVGDINNDGLADLYFAGNQTGDKLYLNKGQLKFEDITEKAGIRKNGWSSGVTMADVNADGLLDIYVCKSGNYSGSERANLLYLNKGNGVFDEAAKRFGLADTSFTTQAAFFDYDRDGDLDVYLLTTTPLIRNTTKIVVPNSTQLSHDKLYQNNGNNTFTDISAKAGIQHEGYGLGLAIADINDDGWEDIVVSNDFLTNDHLYINQGSTAGFTESAAQYFKHQCRFSMGNDVADFNNDGLPDIMQVDMLPSTNEQLKQMTGPGHYEQYEIELKAGYQPQFMRNMLQLNLGKTPDGKVKFSEIGQFSGVHRTDWSWSPLFADFDNDGWKDLFVSNGYLRDITDLDFISYNIAFEQRDKSISNLRRFMIDESLKLPAWKNTNFFFRNKGDLTFEDATQNWFGDIPSISSGSAYADLDNDGDLDLIVNNTNEEAHILKNNTNQRTSLQINLKGSKLNPFGVGSQITIFQNGKLQKQVQNVTRGYASSVDYKLHFGLGNNPKIDSLLIKWSDGKIQKLTDIQAGELLTLDYKNAADIYPNAYTPPLFLVQNITPASKIDYRHEEEFYMDYNVESLLLHKFSQQGPKLAKADINGDGLEDLFVGGSFGHYGKLFIQNSNGTFTKKPYMSEAKPKAEEDIGVIFFDADKDGDQDLYIVSGSNEYLDNSPQYQDRLYQNDGKGNFSDATHRLPKITHSGSCIRAVDFDKDGDLDLFRGGRLVPTQFPLPGDSYLMRNDNGSFKDVTGELAPELRKIGMVTDAQWADVDGDKWPDLVLVGELMPITVFKNHRAKSFEIHPTSTPANSDGLWNCLSGADFDKDGDIDFVAGNLGLNTRYRISETTPFSIYAGDYDNNGRWDAIPTYYLKGIEYPVPARDILLYQIPSMRAKFKNYIDYSKATFRDVLTEDEINNKSIVKKAKIQQSVYLENDGKGNFTMQPLPSSAQWAPIQSFAIEDINHDGIADIFAVGNAYDAEPVAGKYDAFMGLILLGDGKGKFNPQLYHQTGFLADGDCKDIQILNKKYVIVSKNAGSIDVFNIK